ncbi:hypothetical protein K3727_17575 [Rhodobacteraceae bacterium M382]|nr:hypothetical protein K3727_17575 [Rhodobacteraceae bacterium M382]
MTTLTWQARPVPRSAAGHPQIRHRLAEWLCGDGLDFLMHKQKHAAAPEWWFAVREGGPTLGAAEHGLDPDQTYRLAAPLPLGQAQFPVPVAAQAPDLPMAGAQPEVLVLVIDNAISLGHERFRSGPASSRIHAAWIMDAEWQDGRVPFGRMWQKSEIDAQLTTHGDDFDALLRSFGQAPSQAPGLPLAWGNTAHGTQIADLAAGYAAGDPDGAAVGIMAVQLPSMVYWDAVGATVGFFAIQGLRRMLAHARTQFPGVPVVVTFAYSITGGPHDGTHYVESQLDAAVEAHLAEGGAPVFPIIPAGNSYDDQRHARGQLDVGTDLSWRLPPGDRSSNVLEIWVPDGADPTVAITLPDGSAFSADAGIWDLQRDGDVIGRLAFEDSFGTGQRRILLILAPTDTTVVRDATTGVAKHRAPAPAGAWGLRISGSTPQTVRAWIHRDDQDFGFQPFEPQSYLEDAAYEALRRHRPKGQGETTVPDGDVSPIKRSGTISGFAGSRRALTVAGARARDRRLSKYSSAADYSGGIGHIAPLVSAVSDVSIVKPGLTSASNRSGGKRWRSGTSAAVPVVARWLSRQLRSGGLPSVMTEAAEGHFSLDPDLVQALFERQGLGHLNSFPLPGINPMR